MAFFAPPLKPTRFDEEPEKKPNQSPQPTPRIVDVEDKPDGKELCGDRQAGAEPKRAEVRRIDAGAARAAIHADSEGGASGGSSVHVNTLVRGVKMKVRTPEDDDVGLRGTASAMMLRGTQTRDINRAPWPTCLIRLRAAGSWRRSADETQNRSFSFGGFFIPVACVSASMLAIYLAGPTSCSRSTALLCS